MAKKNTKSSVYVKNIKKNNKKHVQWEFPLVKKDFIWLLIGVGVVILGYALLATGITDEAAVEGGTWINFWAVNVAPIILIIGYLVVIPLALMKFFTLKKNKKYGADNKSDVDNKDAE